MKPLVQQFSLTDVVRMLSSSIDLLGSDCVFIVNFLLSFCGNAADH